jgi:hypothetical protein
MNYFDIEPLIKARLNETVNALPAGHVVSSYDLVNVNEQSQVNPAIHILYNGDNVTTSACNKMTQKFEQKWLIIVVTRNMRVAGENSALVDSGEVIMQMLKALQGWKPSNEFSPLQRIDASSSPAYRHGFSYFPFQFSTNMIVNGAA